MPMRIVHSFPFVLGRSGIGTTALQQIRGLVDAGVEVEVWCASAEKEIEGAVVHQTLRFMGCRIPHRLIGVRRGQIFHDWCVSRRVTKVGSGIDVVHTWPGGCLQTLRSATKFGVAAAREAPSEHTRVAVEKGLKVSKELGVSLPRDHFLYPNLKRLELEDREFAASPFILAPSGNVVRSFVSKGFNPSRLVRHIYGYDPTVFCAATNSDAPRPFTAVFVGRLEPAKGVHYLLEAWIRSGLHQDGRLLLCGSDVGAYASSIADRLHHARATRLGFVGNPSAVLQNADVLVLPSVTEGSALVTYEAMACGCVPLVSEASGAPCTHGRDGLFHSIGDVALLSTQLRNLATAPAVLKEMRRQTLLTATELTWRNAGVRLVDAYNSMLELRQKPHRG
jgi:glycosyltransferase involved in cell wall biosynthesis